MYLHLGTGAGVGAGVWPGSGAGVYGLGLGCGAGVTMPPVMCPGCGVGLGFSGVGLHWGILQHSGSLGSDTSVQPRGREVYCGHLIEEKMDLKHDRKLHAHILLLLHIKFSI